MNINEFADKIIISHSGNGGYVHNPYLIMGKSQTGQTTEYVRGYGLEMAVMRAAVAINEGMLDWAWMSCDMGDNEWVCLDHVILCKISYDLQVLEIGYMTYIHNLKGVRYSNDDYTRFISRKIQNILEPIKSLGQQNFGDQ